MRQADPRADPPQDNGTARPAVVNGASQSFRKSVLTDEVVLPQYYANRILFGCIFASSSVISAYVNTGFSYELFCCSFVLCTSINYWRLATKGWRRNLDMVSALLGSIYQVGFASARMPGNGQLGYLACWGAGLLCYLVARHYGRIRRDFDTSSKWHCALHACENLGNVMLYDGLGVNWMGW